MSNLGNKLNKLIERKKGSEVNPWAVCHASTGPETDDKFERCVNKVKSKHKIKEAIKSKLNLMEAPEGEETPTETPTPTSTKPKRRVRIKFGRELTNPQSRLKAARMLRGYRPVPLIKPPEGS